MKISKELHNSIKLMSEGNPEGFTQFYNETYSFVYKRARFIVKNEEDALDLTQETFIQAYKGITSLQDEDKVYSWLSTITYNHGMRLFNKKRDVLVDEEAEEIFDNIESTDMATSPEAVAQTKATSEIIKNMIEELPELQKMALLAFYYDNMKIDDIATMFECSSNTIKSRLNYAKKALQEKVLAHEKANNYRLCSVSPALILMALDALFGTPKYTMPVATANTVFAATKGALFMANAGSTAASVGTATAAGAGTAATTSAGTALGAGTTTVIATGAKVGLSLTAKVAIALTTVTATTAIAVTAATGGFQTPIVPPIETETSSEVDSSSETDTSSDVEIPSESETPDIPPLASIYDVQFTDYADSGHYLIMVTDGGIGAANNLTEKTLTIDSNIYIYDKNGKSYAFYNVDENGKIKYDAIAPFTASDKALAIVYNKFQGVNLLLPDGSVLDDTTCFRSFQFKNDYIIAHTSTGDTPTFNIYDSNLNLLKERITEFDSLQDCYTFGELTVLHGTTTGPTKFLTCVYDKDWNLIDYIEQPDNTLNVYLVLNDNYLWAGDTLRDKDYKEVTLPVPDFLHPSDKQVTITSVNHGTAGDAYAYVSVLMTDASGNTSTGYYIIDEHYNFYKDESELDAFLWVEGHGINVMYPPYTADRYLAFKETGEYICSMSDWDIKVSEVYGGAAVYGISGDMYGEDVLVWVGATNEEGYHSTTFLLKKSDGYSIDKAINIGVEVTFSSGIYYSYDTTQIYLDYKLVDCHSVIFAQEQSYYILQNNDGTFTVYNADQTECFTTGNPPLHIFDKNTFITQTITDGVVYYQFSSQN